MIHFQERPVSALSHPRSTVSCLRIPYGERIEDKSNLPALYREIGERLPPSGRMVHVSYHFL